MLEHPSSPLRLTVCPYPFPLRSPLQAGNCNIDGATAAAAWGAVMTKFPNSNLVSPATAGGGGPWYDAYFAACTNLYGASGCRITALGAHWYNCDLPSLQSYLTGLWEAYNLPIWLTGEWAGGGGSCSCTVAEVGCAHVHV